MSARGAYGIWGEKSGLCLEHSWTPTVWAMFSSDEIPPKVSQPIGLVLLDRAWHPGAQGLMGHGLGSHVIRHLGGW